MPSLKPQEVQVSQKISTYKKYYGYLAFTHESALMYWKWEAFPT